jgi:UDP-N-acetylenolpyruvoylglucosamine reductase
MLAMNAGCYGSETWQKVERVQVLTRHGELLERLPQEYEVGYRHAVRIEESNSKCSKKNSFAGAWLKFETGDVEAARREIKGLMDKRSASQPYSCRMPDRCFAIRPETMRQN